MFPLKPCEKSKTRVKILQNQTVLMETAKMYEGLARTIIDQTIKKASDAPAILCDGLGLNEFKDTVAESAEDGLSPEAMENRFLSELMENDFVAEMVVTELRGGNDGNMDWSIM